MPKPSCVGEFSLIFSINFCLRRIFIVIETLNNVAKNTMSLLPIVEVAIDCFDRIRTRFD